MIETRISSDPDLTVLANELQGRDISELHEIAVTLIERGTELAVLDDALADKVRDLLRERKHVPQDVLQGLQAKTDGSSAK